MPWDNSHKACTIDLDVSLLTPDQVAAEYNQGKTVVMDAGIATGANLALLTFEGYDYICVSR